MESRIPEHPNWEFGVATIFNTEYIVLISQALCIKYLQSTTKLIDSLSARKNKSSAQKLAHRNRTYSFFLPEKSSNLGAH